MTLFDIRSLLLSADPDIKHYFTMSEASAYSYWEETRMLPHMAEGRHEEGWHFYVHRFTRDENDHVAWELFHTLDTCPHVALSWTRTFDTESGYIHHIFECEGY